jgi:hypothetical protein
MPKTETILKIFVSSPNDVANEKSAVVEAVEETNRTWSDFLGVRMEAITCESHCRPGIGDDAQQVINGQLPDYDISKEFSAQSERYAHHLDVPEDVLKDGSEEAQAVIEIFRELELRQGELFQKIGKDLATASDILSEAARVIELLNRRTANEVTKQFSK